MDYNKIIGNIVFDKDLTEIGKIVRIDRLPHILTKKIVPHIVIQVKIGWIKRLNIIFDIGEIERVENGNVWLKINHEIFKERLDREILLFEERRQYRKSKK
ncbi:MAG TPA: hypothetical protein VMZ29_12500 [Candidatus Bathyarchaeia archaeon]|nr:hypothetical protein [Candidatus Bathyarchaeia archaeon]